MNQITPTRTAVALSLSLLMTGCANDGSMARWGKCALIGGGTGGLLGAIESSTAAGWGALGGVVIGGALCALKEDDTDGDGVPDNHDDCANTPEGIEVDSHGCPMDSDNDSVPDYLDKCPNTPLGMPVNADGCPDTDRDGVPDNHDRCPNTPAGAVIDAYGCPVDSDNDGVPDGIDQCPDTPAGLALDAKGCPLNNDLGDIYFDFDKDTLDSNARQMLDKVVESARREPFMNLKITGYTDSSGPDNYNNKLAKRRAISAANYIKGQGIDKSRIEIVDGGVVRQGNDTKEGRHHNRRVDIFAIR